MKKQWGWGVGVWFLVDHSFFGFVYFLPKHDKIYLYTHAESIFYTDYPFYTRFGRIKCAMHFRLAKIYNTKQGTTGQGNTPLQCARVCLMNWWTWNSWAAHETSFWHLLTKRVSRNEFLSPAHETSAHETSFHETSFLTLLTKRVLTKRVLTKRVVGLC